MSEWLWQCPDCSRINVHRDEFDEDVNTPIEICPHCGKDHTLDWSKYLTDRTECGNCDYVVEEDFNYCPKCGQHFGDW